MTTARLEHVNLTVNDPLATASLLERIFGWHLRWQGESIHGGFSVHVGSDSSYVALYTRQAPAADGTRSYDRLLGLNHLGIVVDDLEAAERQVEAAGLTPRSHADYEPGRRFYFEDADGLEFEVVAYARS